jgi:hypothetical protein
MRIAIPISVLGAVLFAGRASAFRPHESGALLANPLFAKSIPVRESNTSYDPYDPRNCNGVDWDDTRVLTVARVTAKPRVNFIKSPYDDDFKAAWCPAFDAACRSSSYLVAGDHVLVGRTQGDFTCVSYQSASPKRQIFTSGWLPSSALTRVAPLTSPETSDWIGTWHSRTARSRSSAAGLAGGCRSTA